MDVGATCSTRGRKFRVGCALLPKKVIDYNTVMCSVREFIVRDWGYYRLAGT